jgi:hypothetical protein
MYTSILTLLLATVLPSLTEASPFPTTSLTMGYRSAPLKRFTKGYFCKSLAIDVTLPTWACVTSQNETTGEETTDCNTPGDDEDIELYAESVVPPLHHFFLIEVMNPS